MNEYSATQKSCNGYLVHHNRCSLSASIWMRPHTARTLQTRELNAASILAAQKTARVRSPAFDMLRETSTLSQRKGRALQPSIRWGGGQPASWRSSMTMTQT